MSQEQLDDLQQSYQSQLEQTHQQYAQQLSEVTAQLLATKQQLEKHQQQSV